MTIGISLITHYDDPEGFADDPEAFARYRELFARDVDCGASCPKCGGDADNIERGTSGTPPTPMTGEPQGLRGVTCAGGVDPHNTTRGVPSAAAAWAVPVSMEIMLCARAQSANRPGNGRPRSTISGSAAAESIQPSSTSSRGAPQSTIRTPGKRS